MVFRLSLPLSQTWRLSGAFVALAVEHVAVLGAPARKRVFGVDVGLTA